MRQERLVGIVDLLGFIGLVAFTIGACILWDSKMSLVTKRYLGLPLIAAGLLDGLVLVLVVVMQHVAPHDAALRVGGCLVAGLGLLAFVVGLRLNRASELVAQTEVPRSWPREYDPKIGADKLATLTGWRLRRGQLENKLHAWRLDLTPPKPTRSEVLSGFGLATCLPGLLICLGGIFVACCGSLITTLPGH